VSRRAEYAEITRQSIVDAARRRFAEQGYVATTIDQIAEDARVAPKTVYAVAGGKRGLLNTVIRPWAEAAEVDDSLARMETMQSGSAVVGLLGATVRQLCEQLRDVIHLVTDAARQDEVAASAVEHTSARIRHNLSLVAEHLRGMRELRSEITTERATDILQFYFRPDSYLHLVDQLGWAPEDAEEWLVEQTTIALLQPPRRKVRSSNHRALES